MFDDDLMIDFTEQEEYTPVDFDPIPRGKYLVLITDGELKECGPTSKNPGKPFAHLETTVKEGPYQGRKVWTNVMLFPDKNGKMISAMGVLQATDSVGKMAAHEFVERVLQKQMIVQVTVKAAKLDDAGNEKYAPSNEIRGFFPTNAAVTTGPTKAKKKSNLPV